MKQNFAYVFFLSHNKDLNYDYCLKHKHKTFYYHQAEHYFSNSKSTVLDLYWSSIIDSRVAIVKYDLKDSYLWVSYTEGWLAHLARHAPRNSRVKYAVGSNLTASINL